MASILLLFPPSNEMGPLLEGVFPLSPWRDWKSEKQFMYLGEARFYHERMREFVKVAQDLEVKEISDGVELPSEEAEETL